MKNILIAVAGFMLPSLLVAETLTFSDISTNYTTCNNRIEVSTLFDGNNNGAGCSLDYVAFETNPKEDKFVESVEIFFENTDNLDYFYFENGNYWIEQNDLNTSNSYKFDIPESSLFTNNVYFEVYGLNGPMLLTEIKYVLRDRNTTDPKKVNLENTINQYIDFNNSNLECKTSRSGFTTPSDDAIDVVESTFMGCSVDDGGYLQNIMFTENVDITKIEVRADKEESIIYVASFKNDGQEVFSSTDGLFNIPNTNSISISPFFGSGYVSVTDIYIYGKKTSEQENTTTDGTELPDNNGDGGDTNNNSGDETSNEGESGSNTGGESSTGNNDSITMTYTAFIIKSASNPSSISAPNVGGGSVVAVDDDCSDGGLETNTVNALNSMFSRTLDSSGWCSTTNLTANGISNLTKEIGALTNLTNLSLTSSSFTTVPVEISNLSSLNYLQFWNVSGLNSLPDELCSMNNLNEFSIGYVPLSDLPACFGNMSSLTDLGIYSLTNMTTLPDSLGSLSNLSEIYIDKTPLVELPNSIGNLSNLDRLVVFQGDLGSIPDSIGNLSSLSEINFRWNNISGDLPSSITNLSNLEILNLSNNNISSIPSDIDRLSSLNSLSFYSNNISVAPIEINNMVLDYLHLGANPGVGSASFNAISCDNVSGTCVK